MLAMTTFSRPRAAPHRATSPSDVSTPTRTALTRMTPMMKAWKLRLSATRRFHATMGSSLMARPPDAAPALRPSRLPRRDIGRRSGEGGSPRMDDGVAEQEALGQADAERCQHPRLLRPFDPLRHELDTGPLREMDHARDE
jgi:hypothetical protein